MSGSITQQVRFPAKCSTILLTAYQVSYGNVLNSEKRLGVTKNLTLFQQDLENETLPQWMFITPNMSTKRTP